LRGEDEEAALGDEFGEAEVVEELLGGRWNGGRRSCCRRGDRRKISRMLT